MKNSNAFLCKDIYLSAFLVASGFALSDFKREGSITTFQFDQSNELLQLVQQYYADHVTVSPIRYGNSLKNLKSMIYSNTNTYGKELIHNYGATA